MHQSRIWKVTLRLGNSILKFLLYKSICSLFGESARRLADRVEYISPQQHAESQVWIPRGERICLTGCLCFAFRPPAPFIWKCVMLLCEQIFRVMRIHIFPQQTSSLYSGSGHSPDPNLHCRTGVLKKRHRDIRQKGEYSLLPSAKLWESAAFLCYIWTYSVVFMTLWGILQFCLTLYWPTNS